MSYVTPTKGFQPASVTMTDLDATYAIGTRILAQLKMIERELQVQADDLEDLDRYCDFLLADMKETELAIARHYTSSKREL